MNYWRWGQTPWPLFGVQSLSLLGVQVTITGMYRNDSPSWSLAVVESLTVFGSPLVERFDCNPIIAFSSIKFCTFHIKGLTVSICVFAK